MDNQQRRQRVAELLRPEMGNPLRWFYISIANEQFLGGVYLKARGETEAWALLHALNLYPKGSDASTQTGEIPDDKQALVEAAVGKHYRLLSKDEIEL